MVDYLRGGGMGQDAYRVAYEEATLELSEITDKFEKLRQRKERIEKFVDALKPLLGIDADVAPADRAAAPGSPELVHTAGDTPPVRFRSAAEPPPDPFQRRIDQALGMAAGPRDVREYTRQGTGGYLQEK
jgi:hypothetical protein